MRHIRLIPILIALAVVAGVYQLWRRSEDQTVATHLDSARVRLERRDIDGALRELGFGLELAEREGDVEGRRELLFERARLYASRRSYEQALADTAELLAAYEDPNVDALAFGANTALRADEPALALEMSEAMLAVAPNMSRASYLVGASHLALAEEALAPLDEFLAESLPDTVAGEARADARLVASLPPGAPLRLSAIDRLRELVAEGSLRDGFREDVELSSEHLGAARAAYVAGLSRRADGLMLAAFQVILMRAGRLAEAADLGRLGLAMPVLSSPMPVLLRTTQALLRGELPDQARTLLADFKELRGADLQVNRLTEISELAAWSEALYTLELWPELLEAADRLRRRAGQGQPELASVATFYTGMAQLELGDAASAFPELESCLGQISLLLPDETYVAQHAAARAASLIGRPRRETAILIQLTSSVSPFLEDPRDRALLGDAWLWLAELRLARGDLEGASNGFAHALAYAGDRRAEIEPRWREAGQAALEETGRTTNDIASTLRRAASAENAPDVSIYEAMLLARHQYTNGNPQEALSILRQVSTLVRDFPPELELSALCHRDLDHVSQMIETSLRMAELGWTDDLSLLDDVPLRAMDGEDRVRWISNDPSAGVNQALRTLIDSGQAELARVILRRQSEGPASAHDLAVFAEFYGELEEWAKCLALLGRISEDDPAFEGKVGLALVAASRVGAAPAPWLERLESASEPDPADLLRAVDGLSVEGERAIARDLARRVEALSIELRGPALLRRTLLAALDGDLAGAEEALERAEAFFDDGLPGLTRILVEAQRGDWREVSEAAARRLARSDAPGAYQRALLRGLEGNAGAALVALDDAGRDPRDPTAEFARLALLALAPAAAAGDTGSEEELTRRARAQALAGIVDPRLILALLLATETPPLSMWAVEGWPRLEPPLRDTPKVGYLLALALARMGESARAAERLTALLEERPPLPWAWVLREEVAATRGQSEADLEALRLQRTRALGPKTTEPVRLIVLEAADMADRGAEDAARDLLQEGLREYPGHPDLLLAMARDLAGPGTRREALTLYDRLLDEAEAGIVQIIVPEYLELLTAAAEAGEITDGAWWAELDALEVHQPEEPAVARELARRTLGTATATAAERRDFVVQRAWDRLERLRQRTLGAPIEELRAGEAAQWADLYRRHDPERARDFAWSELLAQPATPAIWRIWCDALAATGERRRAMEAYRSILSVVPEPETLRRSTLLAADLGAEPSANEDLWRETQDPDLEFALARLRLAHEPGEEASALEDMLGVWKRRDAWLGESASASGMGRVLALELFLGERGEEAREVLEEAMLLASDEVERDALEAMLALLRRAIRRRSSKSSG